MPRPAPALATPAVQLRLPIRLRVVLLALLAAGSVGWFVPRAIAYWKLHGAASEFANYAVCMAGPNGPELLWQRPASFWRLVRRRLLAAPAGARPFSACAPAPEAFAQGESRAKAQQARAQDFVEYAGVRAPAPEAVSLSELSVDASRLQQLVEGAGALLRKDVRELLRPTLGARAAVHPAALPVPGEGRGLPEALLGYAAVAERDGGYLVVAGRDANLAAYRSWDGGKTWLSTNPDEGSARANAGRCAAGSGDKSFRLAAVGDALRLESWQAGEPASSAALLAGERRLLGFSCDQDAAVALAGDEDPRLPVSFHICAYLGRCRELPVPAELHEVSPSSGLGLSIARVRGATVIALSRGSVVRVISSRDDGQTWMPAVVAYDAAEYPELPSVERTPTRLLSLGSRVLLYAGASRPGSSYPVLVSDDLGAGWHAP